MKSSAQAQRGIRWLTLFLLMTFLVPPEALRAAAHSSASVQPLLLEMAVESPDESIRIIVQKRGHSDAPEKLVAELGGLVTKDLSIINAFAATLPAGQIPTLAQASAIRWVSLDAPVFETSDAARKGQYIGDEFNTNSFAGDNGSHSWSGPWREISEADGAESGDVTVSRFLGGTRQGLRIQGENKGVLRHIGYKQKKSYISLGQ